MAINTPKPTQIPLTSFDGPEDQLDTSAWVRPALADIDTKAVSFVLDIDLDEMSVYFAGREIPHEIEEMDNGHAVLLKSETNDVIGVVIRHYLSRVIHEHPDLAGAVRLATIVSGTTTAEPTPGQSREERRHPIFAIAANAGDWLRVQLSQKDRDDALVATASFFGIS